MSALEELAPTFDQAFDALERGDLDRFVEIVSTQVGADCEFRSAIGSVVGGGTYKGVEGVRTWFADFLATTSERHWRDRRYETYGDDIIVMLADLELIGAASGVAVEDETGAVFKYENGRCVRIDSFMSKDEARQFAEAHIA